MFLSDEKEKRLVKAYRLMNNTKKAVLLDTAEANPDPNKVRQGTPKLTLFSFPQQRIGNS